MLARERDLDETRERLTRWMQAKARSGEDFRLSALSRPSAGLSNDTFFVDVSSRQGRVERVKRLVVRLAPTDFFVFPDYDLTRQYRVQRCLGGTDVPVPRVLWLEEDPAFLGCSFYVMEKLEGEIPSEVPPYHTFGFCFEASPARREKLWWSAIEALAHVHRVDWKAHGLSFLGVPGAGTDPLDRQLDYYERYLRWACGEEPQPILRAALGWLRKNRFAPKRVTLCWGDSRLPNLIFRDDEVIGVLDWEMAFLGDPEADLGWWLFLDWATSEAYGIPRLEGFPGKEETIRRYEELTGWRVENAAYHEVFAALRVGLIMARVASRMKEVGIPTPSEDFATDNSCTQRLAQLLGLPPPTLVRRELTRVEEGTFAVQFTLSGAQGRDGYLLSDKGQGAWHEGKVENPDIALTVLASDWEDLRAGKLDWTQAYFDGKLKVEGDVSLFLQLERVISKLRGGEDGERRAKTDL